MLRHLRRGYGKRLKNITPVFQFLHRWPIWSPSPKISHRPLLRCIWTFTRRSQILTKPHCITRNSNWEKLERHLPFGDGETDQALSAGIDLLPHRLKRLMSSRVTASDPSFS